MAASLEARVGPLALPSPAMLASGILGISTRVFGRLLDAGAGAVVTKSLSVEAWEGYANPTVIGASGGGWLNAVGLSNPGAAEFARMLRAEPAVPAIVSLVGSEPGDFARMVAEFGGCNVIAYELNLSCPHVARVGLEVGDDISLVESIVRATRAASGVPVMAKVGLGTANYLDTVGAAAAGGADAITAINTVRAMAIDAEAARPTLSNAFGGLSGAPIKPVALRCVYEIASRHDIPVIGCGGVSTWEDAVEFVLAGACAVQVGSALAGGNMGVFGEINAGILRYMERKGHKSVQEMVGLAKK
ncbi:MAG: dihydroorotate dehydrogenase [Thaumarchaeota archaeon]|nr:dihydroorotate dehydrogenase [Nitrososphaerota archaeon]RNJ71747.1 MAG: dihydroorotate dehydrogenase [Thaumarchaeota archaeon S14]